MLNDECRMLNEPHSEFSIQHSELNIELKK